MKIVAFIISNNKIIFVLFLERFVIIIFLASGGMAELADALDLESSSQGVQVRFLFRAPFFIIIDSEMGLFLFIIYFSLFYFL